MTDPRPYRLRLLLDVEVTEEEWTILSQATVPDPPPERCLLVMVWDPTGIDMAGNQYTETLATIPARPARLVMREGPRFELEATPHLRPDLEAPPVVVTSSVPAIKLIEEEDGHGPVVE